MNTVMVCGNDTQNIAAAKSKDTRIGDAGKSSDNVLRSFRKKLEELGALAVQVQQNAQGGKLKQDDGMQGKAEIQAIFLASGTIEGIEQPLISPVTAAISTETAHPAAQSPVVEGGEVEGAVIGQNAWMQTAMAGESPAYTQDQIINTIGGQQIANSTTQIEQQVQLTAEEPIATEPVAQQAQTQDILTQEIAKFSLPMEQADETPILDTIGDDNNARTAPQAEVQSKPTMATAHSMEDDGEALAARSPFEAEKAETSSNSRNTEAMTDVRETAPKAAPGISAPTEAETRAAEAPKSDRDNIFRIVDSVSTQSKEGKHEFEIGLKPEFLGKVRIKLTMEKGSIHMRIDTDDPNVKQMLLDHSNSLLGELRDKGVAISGMDISYDNQATFDGTQQQHAGRNGSRQENGMNYYLPIEPQTEQSWDAFSLYEGNSTVEFFA